MLARTMRVTLAATAVLLFCGLATASAEERFVAHLKLTSHRPSSPTGASLHLIWPSAPGGKPKPEAKGVFKLPRGTVIDERAVPSCTASDATLQAMGGDACPANTFLGPGAASVITGFGPPLDPLYLDDRWYHEEGEIVAVFTKHGTSGPVVKVNRVEIRGPRTFVARLSLPPGYPPGTTVAPKTTDQVIKKIVGPNGSFITTPPTCPASGTWVSRATSTYDDGSSDTATTRMRCERHG